ncbi:MAG: bacteriohemerythrin [Desulfovibrio sp.]|uniref:bacteriohemerythrin n=1 Tax=Desulfovibrio sp. TaxID=885 RepID=UPI00135E95FC|nr:bacteriohemerythrin [Desulfovibrio sp.]MTJ92853.1 bacteriohemerythrin [Desulfovibrio sp.]
MGVPIIFLIIAPLAGIIAMQLMPPFSGIAAILSLVFSACGLYLLYKYLLRPLNTLTSAITRSGCKEIPTINAACDHVRALEESLRAQHSAIMRDTEENRKTQEKLRQEIKELREKHAVELQSQLAVLETLCKAQAELNALAVPLAAAKGNGAAEPWNDPQLFFKIASDLRRSEKTLLHAGQFWSGNNEAENADSAIVEVFPWKASYSTNIPVIDGQHKLLLSYINRLHYGIQNGCDKAMLLEILDDLTGYAFTHFATEEIFFVRSAYPLTEKHIEEHQHFRNTVIQLRDAVLDGKAFIDIALLEYLKTWLVEHIQRIDAGFAPYVTDSERGSK